MPLPLTVYRFGKIQIGFTFLVPAHPGSLGQRAIKRVCVCVITIIMPPKCLFPVGTFGPIEYTTHTASQLVQPF